MKLEVETKLPLTPKTSPTAGHIRSKRDSIPDDKLVLPTIDVGRNPFILDKDTSPEISTLYDNFPHQEEDSEDEDEEPLPHTKGKEIPLKHRASDFKIQGEETNNEEIDLEIPELERPVLDYESDEDGPREPLRRSK